MSLLSIAGTRSGRMMPRTAVVVSVLVLSLFAQTGLAQTAPPPLNLFNNYFVTGDYVVGGVGLRGLGGNTGITGIAQGTITIPDSNFPSQGVPSGADIVAAYLYWATVESSQTAMVGQTGKFGVGSNLYAITGAVLGNPNAPVSWSSGGCAGSSQGSKTIRTYRADVRPFLPVGSNGNILAGNTQNPIQYTVQLADSGSNGGGAPLTLGASLVIIYRVISPGVKLNSVVIYDGAYAPANGSTTMSQDMRGFYEAAASANLKSRLTHIVGNGQSNKLETVSLNSVNLPSPYGSLPPFPGFYNGSWDNTTWSFPDSSGKNPVKPEDATATTMVVPSGSNGGCVSWGAVIFSTTVQDTDNDGLLDKWEDNGGYYDAKDNTTFVSLPGACSGGPGQSASCAAKASTLDVFVQLDSMFASNGTSYGPSAQAVSMVQGVFAAHGINLHVVNGNAFQEQKCSDSTNKDLNGNPVPCPFPNQPGVVGWKGGFEFLKYQPTNYPDEKTCEQNSDCVRRFQHGRKDSYHYVLFGDALGVPRWTLQDGTLISLTVDTNGVATFTTSTPHGLVVDANAGNGRVNITDAITSPNLNGTYKVTDASSTTTFKIQTVNVPAGTYSKSTDPHLSVASGQAGTGSGISDVGGADSLITLGLWGADGQLVNTQAGTFMHELGHSLGLTHGGFYYDQLNAQNPTNFVRTFEPNCKPNYLSVMNYFFQVDLLGPNAALDYSSQPLSTLDETSLGSGVSTSDNSNIAFTTTKWYDVLPLNGVGSPATRHCDGTALSSNDAYSTMYRIEGPTPPPPTPTKTIPITWSQVNLDVNYDGNVTLPLRGYEDWHNLDLRQIGATGSQVVSPGIFIGGSGIFIGGSGIFIGGSGIFIGGSGIFIGGSGIFIGGSGEGDGELTFTNANSTLRPPRNLAASLSSSPKGIQLNWTPPSFGAGQITGYNIYRGLNTTPAPPAKYSTTNTSFTDTNVSCIPNFFYFYFVTALAPGQNPEDPQRESIPSNTVKQSDCVPPYTFTGFYSPMTTAEPPNTNSYSGPFNIGKSVTAKWTLQDSNGNFVGNLKANTLYAVGSYLVLSDGSCRPSQANVVFGCSLNNPSTCPSNVSLLYSPTTGAKGNSVFRISSSNNQFIFNWDTTGSKAGCYVLELDLDSGQVERTGLKLQ
jgi:hypothetical protein